MRLYAVIHMTMQGKNKITLVNAVGKEEAREVYMKHVGLSGMGTQLKVQEIDTSEPTVIFTISEGDDELGTN